MCSSISGSNDRNFQRANMIAIQRPLQEFNFGINILKDSVAILGKITKIKLITQEMYKKVLMVEKKC